MPPPNIRRKTKTVAVYVSRNSKAGRDRVSGVMRYLSKRPDIRLIPAGSNRPMSDKDLHVDGAIIFDAWRDTLPRSVRKVTFGHIPGQTPHCRHNISLDETSVACAAANLLVQRGYTHFAFIGTPNVVEHPRSLLRGTCFKRHLEGLGFDCQTYDPSPSHSNPQLDELDDLIHFISGLPTPCGIMAYADNRAQSVIDACHILHLSIPEQVSIVGVDNETDICENLRPTLSSVLPDFELCGYLAAEMLTELLDGKPVGKKHLSYGVKAVIERESTQDLRCGGRLVSRADKYLRENFRRKITVDVLARDLNVSRRLLELRFRKILGCSVLERIVALRITEARRLLSETSLPIEEIASRCGYGTAKAFRNAFTADLGQSPRAYRTQKQQPSSPKPTAHFLTPTR